LAELAEPVHELFGCVSDKHIDLYLNVLDQLAYHAQLSVLLEAVSLAFPRIKASTDILPWAIDEFAQRASEYVIFDYLERQPSVAADDPELLARLEDYIEVDPARLAQRLAGLAGRSERDWTSDDFGLENEAYGQNVADLSFEFLAYLKQTEHVPYTKGNLAREQLVEYFLSRRDGKLGSRRRPKPHKRKKREPEAHQHQLCPDYATLNRFLAKRLQFLNLRYHQVAVVFELIPAWLRFLLSRQLIAPEMFEQTLQQLKPMRSDLLQIYSKYDDDPTLRVAVARWHAETADSGSQAH
jgi:hypothetical protein